MNLKLFTRTITSFQITTLVMVFMFSGTGNSIAQDLPPAFALKGVTLHLSNGTSISSATIVWRDGVIESAAKDAKIPFDAYVIDGGDSLHVYPGFLNGATTVGSTPLPRNPSKVAVPGNPTPERAGIQPNRLGRDHLEADSKEFKQAMEAGFTTINAFPKGYMLPGRGDLMALHAGASNPKLIQGPLSFHLQFEGAPGGWDNRAYPSTTMAVMARFRQLLYDASALSEHMKIAESNPSVPLPDRNPVLESLFPILNSSSTVFFHMENPEDWNRYEALRAEFGLKTIVVGDLSTSNKAAELSRAKIPVLVSFESPEKPDWMKADKDSSNASVEWSQEQRAFSERQAEAWQNRVKGIRTLLDAGVKVGFASDATSWKDVQASARTLTEDGGLTSSDILKVLTSSTAEILGVSSRFGDLKPGMNASFSVFTSPFLEKGAKVSHSVSDGALIDWSSQK